MEFTFSPQYKLVGQMPHGILGVDHIKDEPMFFHADYDFVHKQGGPLTKEFLSRLWANGESDFARRMAKPTGLHLVIDSRVTMCMRGAYPAIPGWHCDNVRRHEKYAQPGLVNGMNPEIVHYTAVVASVENHSCTEFIKNPVTVNIDENRVWDSLDQELRRRDDYTILPLRPGDIVRFDQMAVHRATPAKNPGWRWWIRASFSESAPKNEIRNQVQIYVRESTGW